MDRLHEERRVLRFVRTWTEAIVERTCILAERPGKRLPDHGEDAVPELARTAANSSSVTWAGSRYSAARYRATSCRLLPQSLRCRGGFGGKVVGLHEQGTGRLGELVTHREIELTLPSTGESLPRADGFVDVEPARGAGAR